MKIMNNNINFKGYKNVIFNNMDSPMYNFRFISLELNDEGCKDLTEFKKLQSLCGNQDWGDTFHLVNSQVYNSDEFLFLNGRSMFNGRELKALYEQYADLDGYKDVYKNEEAAALKAYTLIASITRRMMENSLCLMDGGITKVFQSALDILTPMLNNNKNQAFKVLQKSLMDKTPLEHVAESFNNYVAKNMKQFFK